MNLVLMRGYAERGSGHIHQSLPVEKLPEPPPASDGLDYTRYSYYCQVSPTANHAMCRATWCKCPCHIDECSYSCG